MAVALAGCAAAPVLTSAPAPMPVPLPAVEEVPVETALLPLTGHTINVGTHANPSLAAKIDNHPAARPQVGLEHADIVFEELVEGGMTRYLAVWQSDVPAEIGPVRSIRPMDPDIVSSFGGIIAYSGGQERFVQLMQAAPVYNAIHGQADTDATFYRTATKDAPHNVLVMAPALVAEHADLAAPARQFDYGNYLVPSTAKRSGTPAAAISLKFSEISERGWQWNADRGAWLRSQDGVGDADAAGAALGATNLVILRVPISEGLGVPKTELLGAGEAWVASNGAYVHAKWSKSAASDRILLSDDAGAPILLTPGNSWVELVPDAGAVEFAAATAP